MLRCKVLFIAIVTLLTAVSGTQRDQAYAFSTDQDHEIEHSTGRRPQSILPSGYAWYPPQTKVPPEFILANTTLLSTLESIALPDPDGLTRGTIIFTTLRFGDGDQTETTEMINSFCSWLFEADFISHTLLITTDEFTWSELARRGHPVYLDRVFPRRVEYVDAVLPKDTYNREFDVQKHWWGMRLVELGFRVVYMDSDNMVLKPNLLDPFNEPYDVQGLSDWPEAELWPLGESLDKSCNLYYAVREERVPRGIVLREYWHMPDDTERMDVPNPCQSTGLWYLVPTNRTIAFMRKMVQRIAYDAVWQWDQTAWNEVIMPFLWGMGGDQPLRYRLLPVEDFANVPVVNERKKVNLPVDLIVLHAGGIHGSDKKRAYKEMNVYRPNFSTPEGSIIRNTKISSINVAATIASVIGGDSGSSSHGDRGNDANNNKETIVVTKVKPVATASVHHWQPTNEYAFWLVLWLILGGMVFGAASIMVWQACTRNTRTGGVITGGKVPHHHLRRQGSGAMNGSVARQRHGVLPK